MRCCLPLARVRSSFRDSGLLNMLGGAEHLACAVISASEVLLIGQDIASDPTLPSRIKALGDVKVHVSSAFIRIVWGADFLLRFHGLLGALSHRWVVLADFALGGRKVLILSLPGQNTVAPSAFLHPMGSEVIIEERVDGEADRLVKAMVNWGRQPGGAAVATFEQRRSMHVYFSQPVFEDHPQQILSLFTELTEVSLRPAGFSSVTSPSSVVIAESSRHTVEEYFGVIVEAPDVLRCVCTSAVELRGEIPLWIAEALEPIESPEEVRSLTSIQVQTKVHSTKQHHEWSPPGVVEDESTTPASGEWATVVGTSELERGVLRVKLSQPLLAPGTQEGQLALLRFWSRLVQVFSSKGAHLVGVPELLGGHMWVFSHSPSHVCWPEVVACGFSSRKLLVCGPRTVHAALSQRLSLNEASPGVSHAYTSGVEATERSSGTDLGALSLAVFCSICSVGFDYCAFTFFPDGLAACFFIPIAAHTRPARQRQPAAWAARIPTVAPKARPARSPADMSNEVFVHEPFAKRWSVDWDALSEGSFQSEPKERPVVRSYEGPLAAYLGGPRGPVTAEEVSNAFGKREAAGRSGPRRWTLDLEREQKRLETGPRRPGE